MPRKPGEAVMRQQRLESNRRYNRTRPERHDFYHSTRWRRLRKYVLAHHPLCEECLREGRVTAGELVDHIVPIESGGAAMDMVNLQVLCAACHNRKHAGGASVSRG